jgi:hypothetical protein
MANFLDYYDLHNSSEKLIGQFQKYPVGKVCRFCKKSYPDVTFNNVPHIVPELFGKNKTSSNFECDKCNSSFQKFESDTSTMVQHYLTINRIKTKNGIPNFQSIKSNGKRSTTLKGSSNELNINFDTNLSDFEYDYENNTLTINLRTRKFSPFSVYKVFLKMGIALLAESELEENIHYLDLLNSNEPVNNGMQFWTTFRYMLKTKYHLIPKVNLYKAKSIIIDNKELPEYTILINFANIIYQFFLPISSKNIEEHQYSNTLHLELFPTFAFEDITRIKSVEMYYMDLNETRKVSITDTIKFHYQKLF